MVGHLPLQDPAGHEPEEAPGRHGDPPAGELRRRRGHGAAEVQLEDLQRTV